MERKWLLKATAGNGGFELERRSAVLLGVRGSERERAYFEKKEERERESGLLFLGRCRRERRETVLRLKRKKGKSLLTNMEGEDKQLIRREDAKIN